MMVSFKLNKRQDKPNYKQNKQKTGGQTDYRKLTEKRNHKENTACDHEITTSHEMTETTESYKYREGG